MYLMRKNIRILVICVILLSTYGLYAFSQNEGVDITELAYSLDNLFLLIFAILVLFMQAGFAMVEAGLNSVKNTVNILFKNIMDLNAGVLLYFLVGYSFMYGKDVGLMGLIGWGGFGISAGVGLTDYSAGALNPYVDWLFQVAFAATAATIVSGAVAGRMRLGAYVVYSIAITGFIYPISGFWKWGGGWLDQLGFYDFAGSVVVHAVGGFAALAGAIILGPRIGRFQKDGKSTPMLNHSLSLTALGVLILWIGWYGFNPGSQLAFSGAINTNATMLIAANTTLAAAMGSVIALLFAMMLYGTRKPDLTMALNGILAGLVGITASADSVTNIEAILIGAVAGALVVLGIRLLEKLRIDDTVGAWPVHGLCGIWGGIATGIFGGYAFGVQVLGSLAISAWAFITMLILFSILKGMKVLRVPREEELAGLDISEHGEIEGDIPS